MSASGAQSRLQAAAHAPQAVNRLQAILEASQAITTELARQPDWTNPSQQHSTQHDGTSMLPHSMLGTANLDAGTASPGSQAVLADQDVPQETRHLVTEAAVDSAWQAPYNHQAYADGGLQQPDDLLLDTGALLGTAANGPVQPSLSSQADSGQAGPAGKPAAAVTMSAADPGQQQQYNDLVVDLAVQRQQQARLPGVRHSKLWEQQQERMALISSRDPGDEPPGTTQEPVQTAPTGLSVPSPSQMMITGTLAAHSVSEPVLLPEDPFHQKLPQHLLSPAHESWPRQLLQNLESTASDSVQQKIPQHLVKTDADSRGSAMAPQSASPAPTPSMPQPQSAHMSLPTQSSAAQVADAHTSDAQSAEELCVSSQASPASAQDSVATAALNSQQTVHTTGGQVADTSSGSRAVPSSSQLQTLAFDSPGAAQQSSSSGLLRASLAEWLADAVAKRLWSAFKKAHPHGQDQLHQADVQQRDQSQPSLPGLLGRSTLWLMWFDAGLCMGNRKSVGVAL